MALFLPIWYQYEPKLITMQIEVITKQDLSDFKEQIISELSNLLAGRNDQKEWLKSSDVRKMLNISPGTLQNLRINGQLPYTKIGGTIFYSGSDVNTMLTKSKSH